MIYLPKRMHDRALRRPLQLTSAGRPVRTRSVYLMRWWTDRPEWYDRRCGSKIGMLIGLVIKRNPKDFPALKSEISKILREAGKNPDGLAHLKIDGETYDREQ